MSHVEIGRTWGGVVYGGLGRGSLCRMYNLGGHGEEWYMGTLIGGPHVTCRI